MSATYRRSCRTCGWTGTYTTAPRGDYAKRKHSCEKWIQKLAGQARHAQRTANIDRTPKPCNHKEADHQHGTSAAYVLDFCRCLPCALARHQTDDWRRRQQAYGRYDRYTDATEAREHVRALMDAGMGLKRIVIVSDISQGLLWKLIYGKRRPDGTRTPSKRVLRTTHDRIMAITLDLAPGVVLDAEASKPTHLKLQALVGLGWSMTKLGDRLGIQPSNIGKVVRGPRCVTAATAAAVAKLYDELSMTLPPEATHRDRIAASRSRTYARTHGWLLPLDLEAGADATDDTGDYLDEQAIYRRLHGDKTIPLTGAERREVVRRCHREGLSDNAAGRRTGIHPDQIRRDRLELGLPATSTPTPRQEPAA